MTIKLWNKKKEQEEWHTNVSFIEHRILRFQKNDNSQQIDALLITFCDENATTIMVSLDTYNIDEITEMNCGSHDNE